MAARASVVAVQSVQFDPGTPVSVAGNAQAVIDQRVVWEEDGVRDGNVEVAADDAAVETIPDCTLQSDDVDQMMLGITDGDSGELVVTGTLIGDATNSKLTFTLSAVQARPWQQVTLPGKKGSRVVFQRQFRGLQGCTLTTEKAV